MTNLTDPEADQWLADVGFAPSGRLIHEGWDYQNAVKYSIRGCEGGRVALARALAWEMQDSEILFEVFEYGIWPSSECLFLWHLVQSDGGVPSEEGLVQYLYAPAENERLFATIVLMLTFGWGFFVVSKSKKLAYIHDHDDGLVAICSDPQVLKDAEEMLDRFKFTKLN